MQRLQFLGKTDHLLHPVAVDKSGQSPISMSPIRCYPELCIITRGGFDKIMQQICISDDAPRPRKGSPESLQGQSRVPAVCGGILLALLAESIMINDFPRAAANVHEGRSIQHTWVILKIRSAQGRCKSNISPRRRPEQTINLEIM